MAPSNLAQDFIYGVDPFGVYTSQYGQRAEQAGLSEGQHRLKKGVSVAGGIVGGGLILPSVLSGGMKAVTEASRVGGNPRARMLAAAKGFLEGAKKPVSTARDVRLARGAVKRTMASKAPTVLSDAERAALSRLQKYTPLSAAVEAFKKNPLGAVRTGLESQMIGSAGVMTPRVAQTLAPNLQSASAMTVAPLALGATVGGLGAGMQYQKGRAQEREFQRRLYASQMRRPPMYKMSSANLDVLSLSYITELEKMAKVYNIASEFGAIMGRIAKRARKARRAPGEIKQGLQKSYQEGYARGAAKDIPEQLADVSKDLKNFDYGRLALPAALGLTGFAGGAAINKLTQ